MCGSYLPSFVRELGTIVNVELREISDAGVDVEMAYFVEGKDHGYCQITARLWTEQRLGVAMALLINVFLLSVLVTRQIAWF